jgi:hypothetical protein
MQILGYIGYAILILFATTWTLSVRIKLGAGLFTIVGVLFYVVAAIFLGVFGINKLHSWWLTSQDVKTISNKVGVDKVAEIPYLW